MPACQSYTLTLVCAPDMQTPDVFALLQALPDAIAPTRILAQTRWRAAQRQTSAGLRHIEDWLASALGDAPIDHAILSGPPKIRKLLLCDMDSTMIEQECLDELADCAGFGAEVKALTDQAMRGEIDFVAALEQRLALLKGLALDRVEACHEARIRLRPGAKTLIMSMKAQGARSILVTGGFDLFAAKIAAECRFDGFRANRLAHNGRELLGYAQPPVLDSGAKLQTLKQEASDLELDLSETMAIGDGANDMAMLQASGLGISLFGKPSLAHIADAKIQHTGLETALFLQGLSEPQFAKP